MQNDIYSLMDVRRKEMGKRIKAERKKLKTPEGKPWSQERLAEKIADLLKKDDGIKQSTIAAWEAGKSIPSLDKLFSLSKIFGCDVGYLLGEHDNPVFNACRIAAETGLSEETVQMLINYKRWDVEEFVSVIDALVWDSKYRIKSSHNHRAVLDLLHFFFHFKGDSSTQKQVSVNGHIMNCNSDGTISMGALRLNDSIVENAVLMEVQQALIDLKHATRREEKQNG